MAKVKSKPKAKPVPTPIPKKVDLRRLRGENLARVRAHKKKLFLEDYAKYGTISVACEAAGIREERVDDWRSRDPIFDKQIEQAKRKVGDRLEKEVIRRATEGEEKGIYNKQGELVDTVYEKSDSLLMFATKRHRPEYRDRMDLPVLPLGTTNIQNNLILQIDPAKLPLDQLEAYERLLSAAPTPVHGSPAPSEAQGSPESPPKP